LGELAAREGGAEIMPPSEDPEAIEALVEVRVTRGTPPVMTLHPYSRDDRGRARFAEPTRFRGDLSGPVPDLLAGALLARWPGPAAQAIAAMLARRGHQVILEGVV
jgi:hypothetical protein